MVQEIKTEKKNFPFDDFKNVGYESHVFGQKSYNGVAFLSKINIDKVNIQFFKDKNKQSRIIVGDIKNKSKNIKLINIYVPNGNPVGTEKYEYKKDWYNSFITRVKETLIQNENIIIGGWLANKRNRGWWNFMISSGEGGKNAPLEKLEKIVFFLFDQRF